MKRATFKTMSYQAPMSISIHALVKRATKHGKLPFIVINDFNPRPREEGDVWILKNLFNSSDFNPRPREEGDSKKL